MIRSRVTSCLFACALAACSSKLGSGDPGLDGAGESAPAAEEPRATPDAASVADRPAAVPADVSSERVPLDPAPTRSTDAAPTRSTDAAPVRSAGCGMSTTPPDGLQNITVNNEARVYIIRVPQPYDPQKPHPIVLAFHGAGGHAADFDTQHDFRATMVARGAIFISPQALAPNWGRNVKDDLAYIDAVLDKTRSTLCVDTGRIFSSGFSWGGDFTVALGCQRGDVIRAIAPVAGGPWGLDNCRGSVAAWIEWGISDGDGVARNAPQMRDFWLKENGCSLDTSAPAPPPPCVSYAGCKAGYPVHWCAFPGGHMWPAVATKAIADFFFSL